MRYSCVFSARRPALLALVLSTAACFLALTTCNDDGGTKPDQSKPSVRLISRSACKDGPIQPLYSAASECSQDCLQYWSEPDGTLHVKHINAGFNCCIDSVAISIEIKGQVALVTEGEYLTGSGCHCLCLYDIEYEITNLPTTVNKIEVVEPYANPGQHPEDLPLCCSFSLPLSDTLTCCVDRCHYPWGMVEPPEIIVVSQTGCKGQAVSGADSVFECVEWELRPDNTLDLKHTNAFANCCLDSITATMEMRGDTIEIVEQQWSLMLCDCICLYDLDLVLTNITPGTYHFRIRYGVFDEGYPKVQWTVNLLETPTGTYCNKLCCGPD